MFSSVFIGLMLYFFYTYEHYINMCIRNDEICIIGFEEYDH